MSDRRTLLLPHLVGLYANAVGRHGPDSPEAREIREVHADDAEFISYADGLDRIKRHLGGCGIDYPAPDRRPS